MIVGSNHRKGEGCMWQAHTRRWNPWRVFGAVSLEEFCGGALLHLGPLWGSQLAIRLPGVGPRRHRCPEPPEVPAPGLSHHRYPEAPPAAAPGPCAKAASVPAASGPSAEAAPPLQSSPSFPSFLWHRPLSLRTLLPSLQPPFLPDPPPGLRSLRRRRPPDLPREVHLLCRGRSPDGFPCLSSCLD
ncbi:proline-rich receptor-like protein kinase PERK9 [Poecilia formosa]|uniref:proline-rich receptor-like protein kinase PERK9 n=1 Tax=Poecilia formosa TaxID=48698 RepID=UPI0007B9882A|nr:PREDICTED: proline-rich receptor-like protein kinase PERK9 [Poecilia formosa]